MDASKYDCTASDQIMQIIRVFQELGGTAKSGVVSDIVRKQRGHKTRGGPQRQIQTYCPQCPGTYDKLKFPKIPLFERISEGEYKLLEENLQYVVQVANSPQKKQNMDEDNPVNASLDESTLVEESSQQQVPASSQEIESQIQLLQNKIYHEGYVEVREVNARKRSNPIREDKIKLMKLEHDGVFCEECKMTRPGFEGFFDVDHDKIEIGQMDAEKGHQTKLSDLRVLCPNCHRDKAKPAGATAWHLVQVNQK